MAVGAFATPASAEDPELTVSAALARRRSIREYTAGDVDTATRDRILWAAFGLNRPEGGGHTAPSWRSAMDVMLHVADGRGVGLYDPVTNAVKTVLAEDIRSLLSPQPFVKTAPLCLIFVSDLDRLVAAAGQDLPEADQALNAHVNSAVAAQNVYLACAALGLGTCLVGGADRPAIATALGLGARRLVTYIQPVGWPA